MVIAYSVRVSGRIWNGSRAWTTYPFDTLPTREQVLAKAADFERVQSIAVTRITTEHTRTPLAAAVKSASV